MCLVLAFCRHSGGSLHLLPVPGTRTIKIASLEERLPRHRSIPFSKIHLCSRTVERTDLPTCRNRVALAWTAARPRQTTCSMFTNLAMRGAQPLQRPSRGRGLPAHGASGPGPSSVPSCQLFQLPNRPATHTTLEDIQDAYEVCSLIPAPGERAQWWVATNTGVGQPSNLVLPPCMRFDAC